MSWVNIDRWYAPKGQSWPSNSPGLVYTVGKNIDYWALRFPKRTSNNPFIFAWTVIPQGYPSGTVTIRYWANFLPHALDGFCYINFAIYGANDNEAWDSSPTNTERELYPKFLDEICRIEVEISTSALAAGDLLFFRLYRDMVTDDNTGDLDLISYGLDYEAA